MRRPSALTRHVITEERVLLGQFRQDAIIQIVWAVAELRIITIHGHNHLVPVQVAEDRRIVDAERFGRPLGTAGTKSPEDLHGAAIGEQGLPVRVEPLELWQVLPEAPGAYPVAAQKRQR